MIESDPVMFMYFTQMFEQQPGFAPPPQSGDVKIKDYHQMLRIINHILTTAPEFNTTGMVGCPPEVRPIADPDDQKAIVSACEPAPFAIASGVKAHDTFGSNRNLIPSVRCSTESL